MLKPIESILFATDLTPNCQQAYEHAVGLSIRFKATLYLLYVIELIPENVDDRVKSLLGKHQWEVIMSDKIASARRTLINKGRGHDLLNQIQSFCEDIGVDDSACGFQSREIIISSGDNIPEDILDNAKQNGCDLIVLGSRKGVLSHNSLGSTIKAVLKDSPIPVTVVPTGRV
jgi:nucleotide-binding universal stress UspA family protein